MDKPHLHSMQKVAATLDMGVHTLFRNLRMAGVLHSNRHMRNIPRPKYIRAGLLTTTFRLYLRGDKPQIHEKTMVTDAGIEYIRDLMTGIKRNPLTQQKEKQIRAVGNRAISKLKQTLAS